MLNIELAIVEANDLTRTGLEQVAQSIGICAERVHSFRDALECERFIEGYAVDTVILGTEYDYRRPKVNHLIRRWVTRFEGLLVIMVSDGFSVTGIHKAHDAGARAFLDIRDDLARALPVALALSAGGQYLSPRVDAMLLERKQTAEDTELSSADIDLLHMLARGMNNHEIANALGVNVRSVYRVRGRLRQALEVRTNEQIVDEARRRGMI